MQTAMQMVQYFKFTIKTLFLLAGNNLTFGVFKFFMLGLSKVRLQCFKGWHEVAFKTLFSYQNNNENTFNRVDYCTN